MRDPVAIRPRSGRSSPLTSRSNVDLPAPLSPTTTSVSLSATVVSSSSANGSTRLATAGSSKCPSHGCPPWRTPQSQENRERENHEQQRQRDRGGQVVLQRRVDGQRHRLRAARQIAGERDRGA